MPSLRVRESWRPNITEIFWPRSYGRQRCVFLVLHGCSTGALESAGCWLSLLHLVYLLNSTRLSPLARWTQLIGTQLSSVQFVGLILPSNSHAVIWTRLRNSFRYLAAGMCHFRFLWNGLCDRHRAEITVIQFQRSLSSGASVYESIMGFFFTSFHFISQFPPTRFPLITAIRMCPPPSSALPWNGIFGRVNRSKHNRASPSDCLVLYPGHLLVGSYPSAEMQSVYSTVPTDWAEYSIPHLTVLEVPMV